MDAMKQLRVDNWGVYFLQRLQLFFSKTDYCDLTLQFDGNVQLKVHRLVMNACTEYFTFLEQTCPVVDDSTIIMPPDLQSDVIVPIVNFMYTGVLEFHTSLCERIYRAAELMNMPILLKVLETQRQKLQSVERKKKEIIKEVVVNAPYTPSPVKKPTTKTASPMPAFIVKKTNVWKKKAPPERSWLPDPLALPEQPTRIIADNQPKPTRFEWPEDLPTLLMDTSFSSISLTSQPLLTNEDENRVGNYSQNKKVVPREDDRNTAPEPVIYGDGTDECVENNQKRKVDQNSSKPPSKRVKTVDELTTTINIKGNRIGDLDHTKIVSEILKQYPDLVKKNKNIRLKLMSPATKSSEKATGKTAQQEETPTKAKPHNQEASKSKTVLKEKQGQTEGPWLCNKCAEAGETQEFVLYYLYRKHMQDVHNEVFDAKLCKFCGKRCVKDTVMMYHLYTKHGYKATSDIYFPKCDQCPYIALSATKLARHHVTHKPQEMQCSNCKLAFTSLQALTIHSQSTGHMGKTNRPSNDCQYCTKKSYSSIGLLLHIKACHLKEAKRDGMVLSLADLENMEDDEESEGDDEYIGVDQKDKVKIISNVKVPAGSSSSASSCTTNQTQAQVTQLGTSSAAEATNNVTGGIAAGLGLVDIVVLDEQRQYVLGSRGGEDGHAEYVLPDLETPSQNFVGGRVITTDGAVQQNVLQTTTQDMSSDELVMVLTDHDYQEEHETANSDNSNIVVLYSHPVDGQQEQFITSQGNLLVNSQTGMLEIRNNSTMTTASSNQLIVTSATEAPIESIEMIQREIENQNQDLKQEPYFEEKKPSVHGQNMPELNEEQPETLAQAVHVEEQLVEQSAVEQGDESLEQVGESDKAPEEALEQPEEVTPVSQEKTVHPEVTAAEQDISTVKEIIGEDETEAPPESNESSEENVQQPEQEQTNEEIIHDQSEVDTTDCSQVPATEEPMEIDETIETSKVVEAAVESPQPDALNETQGQETTEESADDDTATKVLEGIDIPPEPHPSIEAAPEVQNDDSLPKEAVSESQSLEEQAIVTNDPPVLDAQPYEHAGEQEAMEVDGQIEEKEENHLEKSENDVDGSAVDKQNEGNHEEQEQRQEKADEVPAPADEDDTTQTSHSSQEGIKTQSAILEDWDDTDSQQSERHLTTNQEEQDEIDEEEEKEKEKEAAVNKLVDDWEEEEEEEKEKK